MHPNRTSLLAATLALCLAPLAAAAQEPGPAAKPAVAPPARKPTSSHRRREAGAGSPRPAAAASPYDLVPSASGSSSLARARQNSFGTPDGDAAPSGRSGGRVGVGLGGGGTTPGVSVGF